MEQNGSVCGIITALDNLYVQWYDCAKYFTCVFFPLVFEMDTVIMVNRQVKILDLGRQHAKDHPSAYKEEELSFESRCI